MGPTSCLRPSQVPFWGGIVFEGAILSISAVAIQPKMTVFLRNKG
jgi:hypothetical protein